MTAGARGADFTFSLRELSGALGDLGTLLPLMLGAIGVAGLAPLPVLLGFAITYIATGLYYRLPVPAQPMKAVAAVLLTAEVTSADLATGGVMIGLLLLLLGITGWIDWLARVVPQSVLAGLQLGLGVALAKVSFDLMATSAPVGLATLGVLILLLLVQSLPAALIALGVAIALGQVMGAPGIEIASLNTGAGVTAELPALDDLAKNFSVIVLPQLSLTLTNAILLTALLAQDYFGPRAAHVTPKRLSITSGLANLILAPFGALPVCHGAGGLAAHHRFGARSGAAPVAMGLMLLLIALLPEGMGSAALTAIPEAGLGALLLVASAQLALSKRLVDAKTSCWPVIAIAAAITVLANPFWGLAAGFLAELCRSRLMRLMQTDHRVSHHDA